jgi:hypothetical protein
MLSARRTRLARNFFALTCIGFLLSFASVQSAGAQNFGWFNAWSPLTWFPTIEGDVKARLIWVNIASGSFSGISVPGSVSEGGGLQTTFHMNKEELFLDSMVRFQLSRLSVRVSYEQRDFAGFRQPGLAEARVTYSGLRLGGDFDVIQWNRTRVGIDVDYDFFVPTFFFPLAPPANRVARFTGPNAMTLGFHAIYNPLRTIFGASPIVEFRARWPIQGTQVTDWEISGGLASASTLMGSFSLKAGYRNTQVADSAREINTAPVTPFDQSRISILSPRFDVVFEGWFAEFAFYY